jgi:DNA helicase-2/ATP-dependent DNA helicase PcrA
VKQSHNNLAVVAAAGSHKTQHIVDSVLSDPHKRVLVTTYTNENLQQLHNRLSSGTGILPPHVTLKGWFSFLLSDCARPYQSFVFDDVGIIKGFDFVGKRHRFAKKVQPKTYYLDAHGAMFRDGVSEFACQANELSDGRMVGRLSAVYDHIYIDEVQDLAGYDLELLELLLDSPVGVTVVGDPRQGTFVTNTSARNRSFRGSGVANWLNSRSAKCTIENRCESFRCNQAICDFADGLYPDLPATTSKNGDVTGHDGIFVIKPADVADYVAQYKPNVLRHNKRSDTLGLAALNFGASKGCTFQRVLIFPTQPMVEYYKTRDPSKAGDIPKLYVAVTRAKYSVTFVIP